MIKLSRKICQSSAHQLRLIKTSFLLPENDKCKQYGLSSYQPAICFSLLLPSDVEITSIETAQLWVFKKQSEHFINFKVINL